MPNRIRTLNKPQLQWQKGYCKTRDLMDRAIAVLNLFISQALPKKQQHEIVNCHVVWEQNATTNYSSI